MYPSRPIVVLDDDADDQEILEQCFLKIGVTNPRIFFKNPDDLIAYLLNTSDSPLVILSDVNLQKTNGIELKRQIDKNDYIRKKTIPFIFLSTSTAPTDIDLAYELGVHGFFQKPTTLEKFTEILNNIIRYWADSKHPNNKG